MHLVISKHFNVPRMHEIAVAREHGAYVSLSKLLSMKPDEIVSLISDSGLRGRGGAGFPTGKKWSFISHSATKPVYLVINADEGEPGTFKDRAIIEHDPHLLIEGIAIAAYAINAKKTFVYFRGEYADSMRIFSDALEEARIAKIVNLDIMIHQGAGAYICGEESALLNSIEGNRGAARAKPPYPAESGLFGCPTVVQNVETIANLPFIFREGAAAFRKIGTQESPGTKLISISGHVQKPGVYEVDMGTPVKDVLDLAGGVTHGALKAMMPGGVSSPALNAKEALAARIDFESIASIGSALGSGGMIVIGENTCMVRTLAEITNFFAHESCGACTPCREGAGWIARIAERIESGKGTHEDVNLLIDAADGMNGRTMCGLGTGLAAAVISIATKFRKEFEEHVISGKCAS